LISPATPAIDVLLRKRKMEADRCPGNTVT